MPKSIRLLLLSLTWLSALFAAGAAEEKAAPKPKQFLYVLRLVPRLHDDKAWTDTDNAIIGRHFAHLKAATADRKVVFVGRTSEPGAHTFGLVVFESTDEPAARDFMANDPAVAEKIMTAELHPFQVVLQRK